MYDSETQQQFVELRVQGRSYARIAEELKVSRRTLIEWGRRFQFEIHSLEAVPLAQALERVYGASSSEHRSACCDTGWKRSIRLSVWEAARISPTVQLSCRSSKPVSL